MLGKGIRMERVMDRNTKKTVMVPLIHGVGMGPIEGIEDIKNTVDVVSLGGANAVILHKGIVRVGHRRRGTDIGLILHLTATLENGKQALVTSVEEAITMGADAVSVRIGLGGPDEEVMFKLLGEVSRDAFRWGMPLFALMDPGSVKDEEKQLQNLMRAARVGAEMGADLVRIPYSGSADTFKEVVSVCPVPVVAIGGEKRAREKEFLEMVHGVMEAGASGISAGRNIFQYKKPGNMIKAISQIVHHYSSVSKALEALEEAPIESSIFTRTTIW
ncbi:MAG: fructose-bisphosphate aldolase [Deltaproteobacteria bacterium]|nr:fructose-bisphosphate aldolase [Deltaproteobacteria bacterium]